MSELLMALVGAVAGYTIAHLWVAPRIDSWMDRRKGALRFRSDDGLKAKFVGYEPEEARGIAKRMGLIEEGGAHE